MSAFLMVLGVINLFMAYHCAAHGAYFLAAYDALVAIYCIYISLRITNG